MIVANGCPKSGTHALMAFLASLGLKRFPGLLDGRMEKGLRLVPEYGSDGADTPLLREAREMSDEWFIHGHVPAGVETRGWRFLTIFRDPRNVLLSWCRHHERVKGEPITPHEALISCHGAVPFVDLYRSFLGWRGRCLCLRYEDFPAGPEPYGVATPEISETWTGTRVDWREEWDWELNKAWWQAGGNLLLAEAGYD